MAHKILVMSPLHNLGATVASAIIAQGLTYYNKTSTLLFTKQDSNLPNYLGVENINDPTRSIMQIIKLIDNGAIVNEDIIDYAHQYVKNSWLLNVSDPSLGDKDRQQVITHTFEKVTTDVVICDNSDDIDTPLTQRLLEIADMLFIVIDMSEKCLNHLKAWMEVPTIKNSKNVYIIVTRYNEVVAAVRPFAKKINFPANKVCKIHYNPWIQKCTLNGQLHTIMPLARELDPRVANLNTDVAELAQCVNGTIAVKYRKGF